MELSMSPWASPFSIVRPMCEEDLGRDRVVSGGSSKVGADVKGREGGTERG